MHIMRKNINIPIIKSVFIAVVIICGCFLVACQLKPEAEYFGLKDDGYLEDAIRATPLPWEEHNGTDVVREWQSSKHIESFRGNDSRVTIYVDADVKGQTGAMPVIEVRPR